MLHLGQSSSTGKQQQAASNKEADQQRQDNEALPAVSTRDSRSMSLTDACFGGVITADACFGGTFLDQLLPTLSTLRSVRQVTLLDEVPELEIPITTTERENNLELGALPND